MTARSVIAKAKKLITSGQQEEARDLLLDVGYRQLDKQVQRAYAALIPPSDILQEQLAGPLAKLKHRDAQVRRKAAKWIADQSRKVPTLQSEAWLKDPRTTGPLVKALQDKDGEVVEWAAFAIGQISYRYFPDHRAYPALLPLLKSTSAKTRCLAAEGVAFLGGDEGVEHVLPLLHDRSALVRDQTSLAIVHSAMSGGLSRKTKRRLRSIMSFALTEPDPNVRAHASTVLRDVGDRSVLPALETALASEKHWLPKQCISQAIEMIKKRS